MLRFVFENAGFVVITAFTNLIRDGQVDLEHLMRQHKPTVIVYDIAIPYEQNWRLYQHMRAAPACTGVPFVLTTTNTKHVNKLSGSEEIHEIIGKPYDLDEILGAVRHAVSRTLNSKPAP